MDSKLTIGLLRAMFRAGLAYLDDAEDGLAAFEGPSQLTLLRPGPPVVAALPPEAAPAAEKDRADAPDAPDAPDAQGADDYVTLDLAAQITGRPKRTIALWAQTGQIPARREGHRWTVSLAALRALHSRRQRLHRRGA